MDREGVIKIIDFGLARSSEGMKTQGAVGTPIYMAPELWGNDEVAFERSVDVYAFGVVALVLIAAAVPRELMARPPRPLDLASITAHLSGLQPDIIELLHACLDHDPDRRPRADALVQALKRHLLRDKHRASVVMGTTVHRLDSTRRQMRMEAKGIGTLVVDYDGYDFVVREATGPISINNVRAAVGYVIPGCCVLTFGVVGGGRAFVTFDVSNPEVM